MEAILSHPSCHLMPHNLEDEPSCLLSLHGPGTPNFLTQSNYTQTASEQTCKSPAHPPRKQNWPTENLTRRARSAVSFLSTLSSSSCSAVSASRGPKACVTLNSFEVGKTRLCLQKAGHPVSLFLSCALVAQCVQCVPELHGCLTAKLGLAASSP